jgi:hypothetical protein
MSDRVEVLQICRLKQFLRNQITQVGREFLHILRKSGSRFSLEKQKVGSSQFSSFKHPPSFTTRFVEAGCFASILAGRMGRATRFPPQFGHTPFKTVSAHSTQNVHS